MNSYPTDDNSNRIRSVVDKITGTEDADDLMINLMDVLTEGSQVPEVGGYYTFVYNPKTPNIQYDQNPLVAVTEVFEWGFRGINFHWGQMRKYTWNEISGGLYQINSDELADAREIPFGHIRLNS
tara:strand:+ start:308 stop:682 length:375 start_codon:yes stop_codon:yes gene_type:complete